MRWIVLVVMLAMSVLVGCKPTIDTSSEEKMEASIQKVRASLPDEEQEEFDAALGAIMLEGLFDPDIDADEMERRMKESLDGKTASEVIATRKERQRAQAIQEIEELENARKEAEEARAQLDSFTIERSRFRKVPQRYGRPEPQIELTVTNNTEHAISRAYFKGTLATPGRSVPWLEEEFNYEIRGGLEPGESMEWNLVPNMFSEWGQVEERDDMVFTVQTIRLDGPDGEALFEDNFSEADERRLESLREEYGD